MYPRDYEHDRGWADTYEVQVLSILNQLMPDLVMLYVASEEVDKKQATDFEVKMKGGSIAVRLRQAKDCPWRDLTIRAQRDTGAKTELAKIKEGHGFRYFYGWIDEQGVIAEWILVDLHKVRTLGLLDKQRRKIPNGDGTHFIAIPINELREAGCLIVQFPLSPRTVNVQASQEDIDEDNRQTMHRKHQRAKIKDTCALQPALWEVAL